MRIESEGLKARKRLLGASRLASAFVAALVLVGISTAPASAASVSATATATVLKALSIVKSHDLGFGAFSTGTSGTVVVEPSGKRTSKGVTLASLDVGGAASFVINGAENANYSVVLPQNAVISDGQGNTMLVHDFTSDFADGKLGSDGTRTLNVGSTLSVAADQAPGNYSGSFVVAVNYN